MIRVLIRAPSPAVRAGLESLLRPFASLQVIDDLSDGVSDSAGPLVDLQPDVILAEVENRNGEGSAEILDEAVAGIPLVLLVRGSIAEWTGALRQGVKAVLPDNATGPQIAAAIEAVGVGLTVIHPSDIESFLPARALNESWRTLPEALTAREIETLRSMADGLSNKEIAARLGISEHTVKFHVASVMGKLGAASRTEAVTTGIRHGLVLI
jgi:two-component system, NarL family, response regulator YdfI